MLSNKNKMSDLAQLIVQSPSLSNEQKKQLLEKLSELSEDQKNALVKVFEDEQKKYEKLDKQYVAAWQVFAKNLGVISEQTL